MLGPPLLVTVLAALGSPAAVTASPTEPEPPVQASEAEFFVTQVAFGTSMGVLALNTRGVSAPYAEAGYPRFVPTQWTPFSVNGELRVGKHVPAFDFIRFAQARKDKASGGVKTQLNSTLTEISYGYTLLHAGDFSFEPRAGLGLFDIEHRAQATGEVEFDSTLAGLPLNGGPTLSLQKTSAVLDLGLSVSYLAEFGKRKQPKPGLGAGVRIGLRVGGLVQLFDFGKQTRAWKAEGESVAGAPDMRVDGVYVRLFLAPVTIHRSRR